MNNEKGRFIVLYGSNNTGKSEQIGRLVDSLNSIGIITESLKYPIYDLEPTGPLINEAIRKGNPRGLTAAELQKTYADNRRDYEPKLEATLKKGKWIIGEDYTGTGIAWGLTYGVPMETLLEFNKGLLKEDLAICLDGERFSSGIERNHMFESGGKWELNRAIHKELAYRFGWEMVDANRAKVEVANNIFMILVNRFRL